MTSSCDDLADYLRDLANGPGLTVFEPGKLRAAADELDRLLHLARAARCYRFAGAGYTLDFLREQGWTPATTAGKWHAPDGYPVPPGEWKRATVALAIELELALGLHR